MSFCKYDFISELEENIKRECSDATSEDCVRRYISEAIESACIYTSDCFEIAENLGISDWGNLSSEYGDINCIEDVAYYGLMSYCESNVNVDGIVKDAIRIEEIKEEIEELEEEIEELKEEKKELKEEIKDIQSNEDYLEDDDCDEQERLEEIEDRLKEIKSEISELKEEISDLED